jgi:hypothetical protein
MATKYTITKILVTFIDIFAKDSSYFYECSFSIIASLDYNTFNNILFHNNNNDVSRNDIIDASV